MGFLISNNFDLRPKQENKIQDEPKFKIYQKLFKSLNMELTTEEGEIFLHKSFSMICINKKNIYRTLNNLYHQYKKDYNVEMFVLESLSKEINKVERWFKDYIYLGSRLSKLFIKLDGIIEPIARGIGIYSPTMYFMVILINSVENGFYVIPTDNEEVLFDYPDSYELLNDKGEIICFISKIDDKFYYTGITQSILEQL